MMIQGFWNIQPKNHRLKLQVVCIAVNIISTGLQNKDVSKLIVYMCPVSSSVKSLRIRTTTASSPLRKKSAISI